MPIAGPYASGERPVLAGRTFASVYEDMRQLPVSE
jgi:hypothetical protein